MNIGPLTGQEVGSSRFGFPGSVATTRFQFVTKHHFPNDCQFILLDRTFSDDQHHLHVVEEGNRASALPRNINFLKNPTVYEKSIIL
jgi:hypothetical protein